MTTYIPVAPGINLSQHLRREQTKAGTARPTKAWVRRVMREHPEWDWRNLSDHGGTYVNGLEAARHDLTLEVTHEGSTVAMIVFRLVTAADGVPDVEAVVS